MQHLTLTLIITLESKNGAENAAWIHSHVECERSLVCGCRQGDQPTLPRVEGVREEVAGIPIHSFVVGSAPPL